ncbi:MAG: putative serine/threonine kinase anti-sigma factor [Mycobacterium sp.]|jgi:serine/threonine-protein kinase RsbW|nr:putative serine/threonine kinase anti-sigma factor [Mycobacterium sp.]MCW2743583.1 putative serine/threonine kinase anti-sigma factor [Mycobacterium sp.]
MELRLALALPRDGLSVPVARHLVRTGLEELRVTGDCISDIELALTEACANVLDHSLASDDYEVVVQIAGGVCTLRVVDGGATSGFSGEHSTPNTVGGEPMEHGRGLLLMQALMDSVHFKATDDDGPGTVVELVKQLEWATDSPLAVV